MGGHAAAHSQNALCGFHAGDILRRCFQTNQHDLFALFGICDRIRRVENNLAAGRARGSAKSFANRHSSLQRFFVKLRMQEGVQIPRIDHSDSFLLSAHAFVHQVTGDLQRGFGGSLAVSGLQHEKLAVLNRKFHVLHIAVMLFQRIADFLELREHLRHDLGKGCDRLRRTHAGNDIFALRVQEEFSHQLLFAGRRIAGKGDTGAGCVGPVAERHFLYVDRGAPGVRNIVVPAINIRAWIIPGTEDGFDRAHQLFLRILRKVRTDFFFVFCLELFGKLFEVGSGKFDVLRDAARRFHAIDQFLEIFLADFHDNVCVHLDEAAITVARPSFISGLCRDNLHDFFIQSEVQDRIHHAGHGGSGAGPYGDQQRILFITELLACDLLHFKDCGIDLCLDIRVDLPVVIVISRAGFGCDGKALRDRKT